MTKLWIVARHEFLTNVKKRSFLFSAFGVPLFVIVVWAVIFALADNESAFSANLGYVDHLNFVQTDNVEHPETFTGEIVALDSEAAARQALDDGSIGAYFVVPTDYMETGKIQLYSYGGAPDSIKDFIEELLETSVASQINPNAHPDRLRDPIDLTVTLLDSGREITGASLTGLLLTAVFFVMIYMLASQLAGGYLMSGVVEEKANRIIEILITSVSPIQMLAGKLLGLGALGLVQLLIWLGIGLVVGALGNRVDFLSGIVIPTDLMLFSLVYFVLGYFLSAGLMAVIGVITGSEQESRQYVSVLSLLFVIPFFFIPHFIDDPNGTWPVILTLFPLTSGLTVIMRLGFGAVPVEQLILSIIFLLVTTLFVIWAAGKIFRWGTLLYGKKPTPREIWRVLRGPAEAGVVREA